MIYAQCNGCGFVSRQCETEEEAVADLQLAGNAMHRVFHGDAGPIRLKVAEVLA